MIDKANIASIIKEGIRLDAGYHLSNGPRTKHLISKSGIESKALNKVTENIFLGSRFKRCYINNDKLGYGYITASDMIRTDIEGGRYLSKKYTANVDKLMLQDGIILVSCSGTLGNIVLTNSDFNNKIGTHDLIRILPKTNELRKGYLFAFLASKYGYSLLTQASYGGVVKHIEPHHIYNLPVPILISTLRNKINSLIIDSIKLKSEATQILNTAKNELKKHLKIANEEVSISKKLSIKNLCKSFHLRFDADFYINNGKQVLGNQPQEIEFIKIRDLDITVRRPGIFKRTYVSKKSGFPYIKGSELALFDPFRFCKYLSKTKTPFLDELKLLENQILITCAGSVGEIKIITKEFEERTSIGSQDIIRLESKEKLVTQEYLFAYLKLNPLNEFIQSLKYGSVIERIEPFHVGEIPVLIPSLQLSKNITNAIVKYKAKLYSAFKKQEEAIQIIEKEIESWQ